MVQLCLAWVLRAPLAVSLGAHLAGRYGAGAGMAAAGLALSFVPRLAGRLSGHPLPWLAELPYVLAVSLLGTSKSFNLPKRIAVWDKLVHFVEIALFSWIATVFMRGYRDTVNPRIPNRLVSVTAILSGVGLGAWWEIVEYAFDLVVEQDLVKSTLGTVLDLLVDSLGALTGTVLGGWAYARFADRHQRAQLGHAASWLAGEAADPDDADGRGQDRHRASPAHRG